MKTLILRIGDLEANGYPVSLLELLPPAGGAPGPSAPTSIPLTPSHIPETLAPPGMANPFDAGGMRDALVDAMGPHPDLQRIGQQLYDILGQDQVKAYLAAIGEDTRVLFDIRAEQLQNLPWELLCRGHDRLFCAPDKPFCRGSVPAEGEVEPHGWPLRMMIVVGSEPGDADVQAELELENLYDALIPADADIDLCVVKRPSKSELFERLRTFKPHIFHFIGHGGLAGSLSGQAYLNLYVDGHNDETWESPDIYTDLQGIDTLRLAFINACLSDDAFQDGLWSVTDAFRRRGVPAVLGMRTRIAGPDAARFAASFYEALVRPCPLDVAVAEARQWVYGALLSNEKRPAWASPSLQVTGLPEAILHIGQGIDSARRSTVHLSTDFGSLREELVDRRDERHLAWCGLDEDKRNLIVVKGEGEVGKTKFAYLVMERCALRGYDVRYIDMRGRRGDFITVLRLIRDGDGDPLDMTKLLTKPLPPAAFQTFNDTVAVVLGGPLDKNTAMEDEHYSKADQIFLDFRTCLEQSVENPPLVLVLDHFEQFGLNEFRDYLKPGLLTWCASPAVQDIVIMLLLRPKEYNDFEMGNLKGASCTVDVNTFPPEVWQEFAMEFILRGIANRPFPNHAARMQWLDTARDHVRTGFDYHVENKPWKPLLFGKL